MEKLVQENQKIKGFIGQNIYSFAQQLIDETQKRSSLVIGIFNNIDLEVDINSTVEGIVSTFEHEMNKKS